MHPSTLRRFGSRASSEHLRDEDGARPNYLDLETVLVREFATDDYVLVFEDDARLWPVEIVMWMVADGEERPATDTPPRSALSAAQTEFDAPLVVRPRHNRMVIVARQCLECRNVVTLGTCVAFPDGIPLAIASSRHDHRQPFDGDHAVRFERSADDGLLSRGRSALLAGDRGNALRPSDAPSDVPTGNKVAAFGDDAEAPERFDRVAARTRARGRLTILVREAGGAHGCTPEDLCRWLTEAHPVTRALLDRNEPGGPDAWRRYVALWHRAQLRRRAIHAVAKTET